MPKKLIIKIIAITLIAASFLGNLYLLGSKQLAKERTKSFNAGVMYVFDLAQKNGTVSYTDKNGKQITLIIK